MRLDERTLSLCDRCVSSVGTEELSRVDGHLLCPRCAGLAQRDAAPRVATTPRARAGLPSAPAKAPPTTGLLRQIAYDAAEWSRGRSWWLRLPVLAYLGLVLVRHLADPTYASLLDALNLGIHELGHLVFQPFGSFLCAAGGTILQCLAPLVGLLMFARQRDYFAISFALGWLATNLYDVALYVGDARARALPLVTVGGGEAQHDWSYLLGELGILHWDRGIELVLRIAAAGVLVAAIAFGGWLLWRMLLASRQGDRTTGKLA